MKDVSTCLSHNLCIMFFLTVQAILPVVEKEDASPEYIAEYTKKAVQTYNQKNYEESLDHIRHVIISDLQNSNLRYIAAHNYWHLKNYKSAISHFKSFSLSEPNHPSIYIELSLLYLHDKQYAQAIQVAREGYKNLTQDKHKLKLLNIIARAYLHEAKYSEALRHIQFVKTSKVVNRLAKLEALVIEARVYLSQKQYNKATISLEWASAIQKTPYISNMLGYTHHCQAQLTNNLIEKKHLLEQAHTHYRTAIESMADQSHALYNTVEENLRKLDAN